MKILIEKTNNASLKRVLVLIAKQLNLLPINFNANEYCIHHLDHDDTNNEIYNIVLMKHGKHSSYHKNHVDTTKDREILLNTTFSNDVIYIGPEIQKLLDTRGPIEDGK